MVDRDNSGSAIGDHLLLLTDVLFGWWHWVRDGTLSRRTFRRYTTSLREDVLAVLEQGRACGCAKTAARLLTVVQTRRRQGHPVLDYL